MSSYFEAINEDHNNNTKNMNISPDMLNNNSINYSIIPTPTQTTENETGRFCHTGVVYDG